MIDKSGQKAIKVYQYRQQKLFFSYVISLLLVIVFIVTIFQLWQAPNNRSLQMMAVFIPLLLAIEFYTLNEPTKITDDGEYITFYAFSRKHAYKWQEMTQLKVKQFAMSDKILVQIGNKLLSGQYWINTSIINNGPELLAKLKTYDHSKKKLKGPKA